MRLTLLTALLVLFIAAAIAGTWQPEDMTTPAWFTTDDGHPCVCILGVMPGQTIEQARSALERHPLSQRTALADSRQDGSILYQNPDQVRIQITPEADNLHVQFITLTFHS